MNESKIIGDRISLQTIDGIAFVRLNRPERMNAIDGAMFAALAEVIERLQSSRANVVVLSGEGRAFCAGLDKTMFAQMMESGKAGELPSDLRSRTHGISNLPQHVVMGWRALPMPVIAAVHGVAFGGGLQLALGADLRFVAPDARFSVMEIRWGLVPDMGGMALLPRLVRDDVLRDLIFTGREVSGTEAAVLGIATHISPDPLSAAIAAARSMALSSPSALRAAKRLANRAWHDEPAAILLAESEEQQLILGSAEHREAVAAALAGRPPRFAAGVSQDPAG